MDVYKSKDDDISRLLQAKYGIEAEKVTERKVRSNWGNYILVVFSM